MQERVRGHHVKNSVGLVFSNRTVYAFCALVPCSRQCWKTVQNYVLVGQQIESRKACYEQIDCFIVAKAIIEIQIAHDDIIL